MPLRKERTAPWTPSLLGEDVLTKHGGGVGGAFYASGGAVRFLTPDDFSLVPPGGTVSGGEAATALLGRADECRRSTKGARVSGDRSLLNHGVPAALCAVGNKKEMVGPTAPPHGVWVPSSAARGRIPRPRLRRNRPLGTSGTKDSNPSVRLRRPAPFTQGRLILCGFAADQLRPLRGK